MDELLETARKCLQAGDPRKALLILKRATDEKPEYIRLLTVCRNSLSEQYVYIIKEKLNRNQLSEAQQVICQYQEDLGTDAIIKGFIAEIDQRELKNNNLLDRIARFPLNKITNITTALFTTLIFISFLLGYIIGDEEPRNPLLFGGIAGFVIQTVSFVLYLSLVKNSIWRIDKRKIIDCIFAVGFSFIILSQLLEFYSIASWEDYYWEPALSIWNLEFSIKYAFGYWNGVSLNDNLRVFIVGISNMASLILYIIAFSLIAKFGQSGYGILCKTGVIFLSLQFALLIFPYSRNMSIVYIFGMIVAFLSWCRFFFILRKTVYNNH